MRLIDVNTLWKCETCFYGKYGKCSSSVWCEIGESYRPDVNKLTFIDPVHAAGGCYCWECKYWGVFLGGKEGSCRRVGVLIWRNDDDFCSRGERRVE